MNKKEIKDQDKMLLRLYMDGGDAMKRNYESRNCGNCKWISEVHPSQCANPKNYTFDWMEVPKDFSCNNWEQKINTKQGINNE